MRLAFAALSLLIAAPGLPAYAESPAKQTYLVRSFICPISGKSFEQEVGYSAFPLITMPDGSWLGDTEIGAQIPVCPDNGLVLIPDLAKSAASSGDRIEYADYSTEERAKLPGLIADPAYQALKADGPYAQAWWLATQLGRPAADRFFTLQRSTWATRDPATRKRLVARFAEHASGIIAGMPTSDDNKRSAQLLVVNALRELGRFDDALMLLESVQRKQGAEPIDGRDSEWLSSIWRAISEKDDGRFAAAMLPNRMVNVICSDRLAMIYGPTSEATKAACRARRVREAQESQALEQEFAEAQRLQENPKEREAHCTTTPAEQRSRGLQRACDEGQRERDQIASLELAKQPEELATDCAAAPEDQHKGPLRFACKDLDQAVGEQMGELLVADASAYKLLCIFESGDPDIGPEDRSEEADEACRNAKSGLEVKAVEALMVDLPALDARCKAYGDRYDDEVLADACWDREQALMEKDARRLFEDKTAFDNDCGRFRSKMKDGWITESEKERACRSAWELQTGRVSRLPNDPVPESEEATRKSETPEIEIVSRRLDSTKANEPLQAVARKLAEAIIARAKAEGTYPKRQPGDRE